jgi:hypothetical protein
MRPRLHRGDGGVILRLAIRPGADGIRTFTTGLAGQQQALTGTEGSIHLSRPGTGMSCA